MPLHLERIAWMPSPPLAPDDGPIDIEHLARMTLGDASLEREVLAMFSAQAGSLIVMLEAMPEDAGALAHTLKGSAAGIGAKSVARAAEAAEQAAAHTPSDLSATIDRLAAAVDEARVLIAQLLKK